MVYVLVRTGLNEEVFEGETALDDVLSAARDYFTKGFQVEITKRPALTGRESTRSSKRQFDSEVMLARAKNSIDQILVPADVMVDFIRRMRSVETMAAAKWASPRDELREDGGGSWATIQQLERMGKEYYGTDFSALLGTTGLLRTLFELIREDEFEAAKSLVRSLDGGERQVQSDLILVERLLTKIGRLYHKEHRELAESAPERYTYLWIPGWIGPAWAVFEFNACGKLKTIDVEEQAPASLTS